MTPEHSWQVHSSGAQLRLARFSAAVDVANPADGLGNLTVDGQSLRGISFLGVDLPGQLTSSPSVEHYARGSDLITTYGETPQWPLRAQIYWRAAPVEPDSVIAAIELLASVQTSLLDACPRLTTRSALSASDIFRLVDPERGMFDNIAPLADSQADLPACFVFRLASTPFSYAEMVAPAVIQTTRLSTDQRTDSGFRATLAHQLFAERLEKGVILRARVLGVLVDRDDDLATAARQYTNFVSAAPPLTT